MGDEKLNKICQEQGISRICSSRAFDIPIKLLKITKELHNLLVSR
jgi:hypothetical protein